MREDREPGRLSDQGLPGQTPGWVFLSAPPSGGPRDSECVASVSLNTGRCLVPCHGLYADVKESGQLRLKVDKQPEYELLVQEYENYKHFNEVEIQRSSIKGRHNRNLCTSFIHMIDL